MGGTLGAWHTHNCGNLAPLAAAAAAVVGTSSSTSSPLRSAAAVRRAVRCARLLVRCQMLHLLRRRTLVQCCEAWRWCTA
jgi:hypothetical protein